MSSAPAVLVCDRYQKAAYTVTGLDESGREQVPPTQRAPLRAVLEQEHSWWAHFLCYDLAGVPAETPCPRLAKPLLHEIRELGADVVARVVALDWDTPGHARLTEQNLEPFSRAVLAAPAPLSSWYAAYTTAHGARIVYVLSRPVPVDEVGKLVRGLLREWNARGLAMDPTCDQWWRMFGLPKVTREGEPSWRSPLFDLVFQQDQELVPESVRPEGGNEVVEGMLAWREPEATPWPTDDAARAIALDREENPWFREAERRCRGRRCHGPLFDYGSIENPEALAREGGRIDAIQSFVGEACAILHGLPGTTEERVYGLFWPSTIECFVPDAQTPDWRPELWSAVRRYWAREDAKARAAAAERARREEGALSTVGRIVRGMRSWCEAKELHGEDAEAAGWASQRLIACTASNAFVMRPDGWYDDTGVTFKQLPARIRSLGMDSVIPLQEMSERGAVRSVTHQELIDRYATIVRSVEGVAGSPSTLGAKLRGIDSSHSTMEVPLYRRRTDLEPKFDAEIDGWLRAWAGTRYEKVCAWLGHAVAFEDGPICALSIAGAPGIGKKMVALGLSECIDNEVYADGREFEGFQTYLMKTPFLVINEGFPKPSPHQQDPADRFRAYVGGDPIHVRPIYQAHMAIRSPVRIVFLANNLDVVGSLSHGRDLSPDDREALVQRLLHIDCPPEAALWLPGRGGLRYTGMRGRRWVRGDSGEKSDYVLARHILYLYENRPPVPSGARFLVEGEVSPELLRILSRRSGSAPIVIETIVRMIESKVAIDGCIITEQSISVTIDSVVRTYYREMGRERRRDIDHRGVANVLKSFILTYPTVRPIEVSGGAGRKKVARWWQLDPRALLQEAEEIGYQCERLTAIAQKAPKVAPLEHRVSRAIEKMLTE